MRINSSALCGSTAMALEFDYAFAEDTLERIINGPISREQNEKRQKVVVEGWIEGLPQDMRERILEGSLRDEDLDVAKKRLRALSDDSDHVPKTEYLTLAALVEVAMLTGKEDVAKELAQYEMAELYLQLQEKGRDKYLGEYEFRKWQDKRLDLLQSLRIWKILKDIALGKVLQIDEEALERSVQEGYPESGRVMKVVEDTVTDTFLRPGVSEAQIRELEKRLAQNLSLDAEDDKPMLPNGKNGKLPEDYKEFLRISNGYFPEGNPLSGLFYSYDEVGTVDCAFLSEDSMDLGFSLFPYVYTSIRGIDNI
ncbi:SMI1-KNR4 domain containing protein [Pyrenophora teres f. teres]|uniref:SMI1-KNR4 domain containing protein n=1 Tax=Pyrenophora teres f. teres TaxID=97479 RepID=A0A6S6W9Y8_9PLEO|nr:SMI1-KNR4 domain containing protein [Pyrenophora teres f. teres]